ncbi:MAG: class I SAM-dependent methyltransferase [Gammaproteobacteria bacterium]|nr:class I SAM-dependent methyltransferase [Gammaproteobacteria bacterium]
MNCRASQLNSWFESPLGHRLLREEAAVLSRILPQLFGYHLIQVGCAGKGRLLESSRISRRYLLSPIAVSSHIPCYHILGDAEALPIPADCLDVAVLAHVLEFQENPHQVLREVERVLIPEGHVVLIGFNPFSLWGVRRLMARRKSPPWCGQFLTSLRLKDWLALLGFDLISQQTLFFPLPLQRYRLSKRLTFTERIMERIGKRWFTHFGGAYLLVAKKRQSTLTPIRPKWHSHPGLAGNAVRPAARGRPAGRGLQPRPERLQSKPHGH